MRYGIKTLSLIFTLSTLMGCSRVFAPSAGKLHTIAFYNTQNLYDTINDPQKDDDAYTPDGSMKWDQEKYNRKIQKIAQAIAPIGGSNGPAIIGLTEVENALVLQDLLGTPELKKAKYEYIHFETDDPSGLDLAILYKPNTLKVESRRNIKVDYGSKLNFRDIVQVNGKLQGEPVTIFVNHWPPRAATRRGQQDDSRLRIAAATLRKEINAIQAANPDANIIVMGDFDAEPRTKVMEEVLKATGRPNPYYKEELFNTFYMHYVNGLGSYFSRGDFKMMDQILVSKSLLSGAEIEFVRGSAKIHDPEELKFLYGKYKNTPVPTFSGNTYFGGASDHFPVYIQVKKAKR
ncbi:endonuclease/exonuclease/phosphatase family protein [Pontibacter sp. H249]|uniref:endonuclease/exonuclease/phosphatase family protein n=1 Tax=Pontibacter sp. H249 TaxID=3133420 RepID=UPI0030BC6F79